MIHAITRNPKRFWCGKEATQPNPNNVWSETTCLECLKYGSKTGRFVLELFEKQKLKIFNDDFKEKVLGETK